MAQTVDTQESVQTAAYQAVNYSMYLWHLIKDKPVLVAMGSIISSVASKATANLPDHAANLGALVVLVTIDFFTKLQACRATNEPFTSKTMRDKGLPKLRDYMILYVAGAMTVPLIGDTWGLRGIMYFLGMVELWSIAENLYDSGNLPFDIRRLAMFDGIREMIAGGTLKTPFDPTEGHEGQTEGPKDP